MIDKRSIAEGIAWVFHAAAALAVILILISTLWTCVDIQHHQHKQNEEKSHSLVN